MATAADIITSARFDLRDTDETQYSDAMLLDFLNRGLRPLSVVLSMLSSDWVNDTSDLTLASAASTITLPTYFISDITVRISTDYLTKNSVSSIRHTLVDSTSDQPENYAIQSTTMMFERVADAEYTVVLEYNKYEADLASTDTMPYNGECNDILRQFITLSAKSRNEYSIMNDAAIYDFFYEALFSKFVARNYISNFSKRTNF